MCTFPFYSHGPLSLVCQILKCILTAGLSALFYLHHTIRPMGLKQLSHVFCLVASDPDELIHARQVILLYFWAQSKCELQLQSVYHRHKPGMLNFQTHNLCFRDLKSLLFVKFSLLEDKVHIRGEERDESRPGGYNLTQ